jgi:hypothetical protein
MTRSARKVRAVLNWPRPPRSGTAIACAWRSAQRLVFSNVRRRRPRCRPPTIGFVERRLWSRNPGHHPPPPTAAYFEGAWGKPAIIYPFTSSAYDVAPGVLFTEAYDGYLLGSKTLGQEVTYLEGLFQQGAAYLVRNDGWTGQPWASSLPSSP